MAKYAANTKVPVERSRLEIERTLVRYGVEAFFYGTSHKGSGIGFKYKDRAIQMSVPLPERKDFADTQAGEGDWKREHRRLWRVLLIAIKAKLELVDAGLAKFEDEFLAQTCLPGGGTVSQVMQPQIETAIKEGRMPKLLTEGI